MLDVNCRIGANALLVRWMHQLGVGGGRRACEIRLIRDTSGVEFNMYLYLSRDVLPIYDGFVI